MGINSSGKTGEIEENELKLDFNLNTTKVERPSPRQLLGYRNISYPHFTLVAGSSYCVSFQT